MNRTEILHLTALVSTYWPTWHLPPDDEAAAVTVGAWSRLLADVPLSVATAAVDALAAEAREFAPPAGVIRERAVRLVAPPIPDFDQAWAEVTGVIGHLGFQAGAGHQWSHPAIAAAVEAVGWRRLCYDENPGMLLAHFRDCYRPVAKRAAAERALPPAAREVIDGLAGVLAGHQRELDA